jgi:fatty acid-binding protein DegV
MRTFIYLFFLALLPATAQSAAEVSNWPVQQKIDFLLRITDKEKAEAAAKLRETILEAFPKCDIFIEPTTALCSFYAEQGGLLVGFESK